MPRKLGVVIVLVSAVLLNWFLGHLQGDPIVYETSVSFPECGVPGLKVVENALPKDLLTKLQSVLSNGRAVSQHMSEVGDCCWLPFSASTSPSLIRLAILEHLTDNMFENQTNIEGMEWWVQIRKPDNTLLNAHWDRDDRRARRRSHRLLRLARLGFRALRRMRAPESLDLSLRIFIFWRAGVFWFARGLY